MSSSSSLAYVAGSWGVLMSLAPLLQIRAMVRTRSSASVSLGYLGVLAVGFALWLAYGLSLGNTALVVTNIVSLIVGLATITVARRFRPQVRPCGVATSPGARVRPKRPRSP